MKRFISLFFSLSIIVMSQSCSVSKGLAGISPERALAGVQALLGGASNNAIKGFAGNVLQNAVMQKVMPKGLSNITSILGQSSEGTKALGLLNSAIGSSVTDIAGGFLGQATKGIAASDALSLLQGGDNGATNFLKQAAGQKLLGALEPMITKKLTMNGGLNAITSALGSQASGLLGNGKPGLADLATTGAVDGLFAMMGNAEKAERANPTDPILKEIFGK